MSRLSRSMIMVAIMFFCFIFGGCGGGGRRDNVDACVNGCPGIGGEEGPEAAYAGPINYASIDQSNLQSLIGGAFVSGQFNRAMADRSATQDLPDIDANHLRTLRLPLILSDSIRFIDLSPSNFGSRLTNRAVRTGKGTENGRCGGSFEFLLDIDDARREFSGAFTYSKYCEQGFAITGKASVRGTFDNESIIRTIDYTFSNFTDDRIRMQGDLTIEFTDTRIECYMNYHAEDTGTGKVYWMNPYSLYIYEFSDRIEFDFYGDYHDPDYGYVEVATIEIFRIYGDGKWPSFGSLLIQGKDHATAELIAIDSINCVIRADLDGDDILDFESEVLSWESLEESSDLVQVADILNN